MRSKRNQKLLNRNQPTETLGLIFIQQFAHQIGAIWRPTPNDDYGLDGELELTRDGVVTGLIIKVQLKTGQSYFRRRSTAGFEYRLTASDAGYWDSVNFPVILVVYDPERERAYWMDLKRYIRSHEDFRTALVIRFSTVTDILSPEASLPFSRDALLETTTSTPEVLAGASHLPMANRRALILSSVCGIVIACVLVGLGYLANRSRFRGIDSGPKIFGCSTSTSIDSLERGTYVASRIEESQAPRLCRQLSQMGLKAVLVPSSLPGTALNHRQRSVLVGPVIISDLIWVSRQVSDLGLEVLGATLDAGERNVGTFAILIPPPLPDAIGSRQANLARVTPLIEAAPVGRTETGWSEMAAGASAVSLRRADVTLIGTLKFVRVRTVAYASIAKTIAISPDGRSLAAASMSSGTTIWDLQSGRELRSFRDASASVIAFSPDSRILVTSSDQAGLSIFDPGLGLSLERLRPAGEIRDLSFSPNGTRLVSAGSAGLSIWDLSRRRVTRVQDSFPAAQAQWSDTGRYIASVGPIVAAETSAVRLWDKEINRTSQITGGSAVAFSPGSETLAVGESRALKLLAMPALAVVAEYKGLPTLVGKIAFSPNGELVVAVAGSKVMVFRSSDLELSQTIRTDDLHSLGTPLLVAIGMSGSTINLAISGVGWQQIDIFRADTIDDSHNVQDPR